MTKTVGDIADFVPKLVAFVLIFLVGSFIAKMVRKAITTVLHKIRFDDYIDAAGIGTHIERAGFADSGRFVAQIIYYLIMLLVLKLGLSAFGQNDISDALDGLIAFIPKIIVASIIVIITGLVANTVANVMRPALSNLDYGSALTTAATTAIWVIGIFAAIDHIEVANDIVDTLFTAIVGSLGLILVIKFGVGGIWAARDHFWPAVYRKFSPSASAASPDRQA
ncbi:MAG: hypothetical protein R2733_11455 [Acidimicrobiales bacterium]